MKPYYFTIFNAIVLIIMGVWGYFDSANRSFTAFIPVAAGIILLALSTAIKASNKFAAHTAVILTLVLLISLIKPLSGGMSRNDTGAIARILIMMLTCLLAVISYVMSFVNARKQRNKIS